MPNISRRGFLKTAVAISALPMISQAKENNETLKFIHITDSHMDLADLDSINAMNLMVKFINKEYKDLDFVLFGGDNYNNNIAKNADALKFKNIIDKLHCPSYVVRGNKEARTDISHFKKIFLNDKSLLVEGKDWMLEKKGYQILGLDSCIENANNGIYTDKTINFAKSKLQNKKPTLILNHHPYINYWNGKDEEDMYKYVLNNSAQVQNELFVFDNLILTLSGHKHIDSVKEINNTKVIATRGFIRPLDMDMYPMRYVEIYSGEINEKLIYTS